VPSTNVTSVLACVALLLSSTPLIGEEHRAAAPALGTDSRIACSQERGQPLGECTVRVRLDGDGKVTVVARFANGFSRSLRFDQGAFVRANATMSGSGADTDWQLIDGLHRIRVDDQRYEVPDTLVSGG